MNRNDLLTIIEPFSTNEKILELICNSNPTGDFYSIISVFNGGKVLFVIKLSFFIYRFPFGSRPDKNGDGGQSNRIALLLSKK